MPDELSVESANHGAHRTKAAAAKSTLLRIIIRLSEPDSGAIEFDGKPITPDNINALRRRWLRISGGRLVSSSNRSRQCSFDAAPHLENPKKNAQPLWNCPS